MANDKKKNDSFDRTQTFTYRNTTINTPIPPTAGMEKDNSNQNQSSNNNNNNERNDTNG